MKLSSEVATREHLKLLVTATCKEIQIRIKYFKDIRLEANAVKSGRGEMRHDQIMTCYFLL